MSNFFNDILWKVPAIDQLNEILHLAEIAEKAIDDEYDKRKSEYDVKIKEEDIPHEYEETLFDWLIDCMDRYPFLLRSSLTIATYSLLEQWLVRACRMHEHNQTEKLDAPFLDKAKDYLKSVVKVNLPTDRQTWQAIKNYQAVRNWLVHGGRNVKDTDKAEKVKRAVEQLPHIKLLEDDSIDLEEKFCIEFVETAKQLISEFAAVMSFPRPPLPDK